MFKNYSLILLMLVFMFSSLFSVDLEAKSKEKKKKKFDFMYAVNKVINKTKKHQPLQITIRDHFKNKFQNIALLPK